MAGLWPTPPRVRRNTRHPITIALRTHGLLEVSMAGRDLTPVAEGSAQPFAVEADQVASDSGVDPDRGLSAAEVQSRLASHGPNRLVSGKKEPGWRAFLRQYEDFMQVILLAAAAVNQVVTG